MYARYLASKRKAVGVGGGSGGGSGSGTGSVVVHAVVSGSRFYAVTNPVPAAYAEPEGNALPRVQLLVNSEPIGTQAYVTGDLASDSYVTMSWGVPFARSAIRTIELAFDNDWASSPYQAGQDRNVGLQRLIVDPFGSPVTFLPSDGDYRRDVGSIDSPGPTIAYVNGRWRWLNAGTRLGGGAGGGTVVGQGAITRVGNTLEFNGKKFRGFFPNFHPWAQMDGTWSDAARDRAYAEIARIKSLWGANGVRLVVSPGEWVYWTAQGKYDQFMDGLLDAIAAQGMFAIIDYWTVRTPGVTPAENNYPWGNVQPFYMSEISTWEAFWGHHAERYRDKRWLMFCLWDEVTANSGWQTLRDQYQRVVNIIRQAGAQQVLIFGGLNYSRDVRDYDAYPLNDPLGQLAIQQNEFGSESNNFPMYMTASGGRLDLRFPWVAGGYSFPVSGSPPMPTGNDLVWSDRAKNEASVLSPWSHSRQSDPAPLATGWSLDETPTFNSRGVWFVSTRPPNLVYQGETTAPPSETFTGDVFLDTVAGNDALGGTTEATAVKSWARAAQLMGPNKKLAIKRGSVINQFVAINGWAGATIGVYGTGPLPRFRNSRFYSGSQIEFVRSGVWRVNVGAMPLTTGYAAARVSHATLVIVNDSHVCTWFARNGEGEVGARNDQYWHNGGYLTFASPVTPTLVEVPWEDVVNVQNSDGIALQDIDICSSRGHGLVTGQVGGLKVKRCTIRRCGLSGAYVQSKANAITYGVEFIGNLFEDIHAEGLVLNWPADVRNCFRTTKVKENTFRRCCKGPPFIRSGTTSQDYYSGGVKIFTDVWESPAWDNDIEVAYNLIEDIGNLDANYVWNGEWRYDGASGYESNQAMGIWPDTVTGGTAGVVWIHHNTIRRTWAAGVFVEFCPGSPHLIEHNFLDQCGLKLQGWSGALCAGRGTGSARFRNNTVYRPGYGGLVIQGGTGSVQTGDGRTVNEGVSGVTFDSNIVFCENSVPVVIDRSRFGYNTNAFLRNCFYGGPFHYRGDSSVWSNPTSYANAAAFLAARGAGVSGSVEANPQMVAPASGNIALAAGSPCLGAGVDGSNIGAWQG